VTPCSLKGVGACAPNEVALCSRGITAVVRRAGEGAANSTEIVLERPVLATAVGGLRPAGERQLLECARGSAGDV
jgi:hypothetical protein